eukprot:TRINITY_DN42_c0_g1_i1.p1 TRINITY_DN42_c0_g1~~TRINITY_DN42_c0_g1_i1.p1  ORF type:complete len:164 (-),score=46.47 TRINITY_DN42_c0_g1_i1:746-1237(-)
MSSTFVMTAPEWLLGPTATVVAVAFLMAAFILTLSLSLVQMKADVLVNGIRETMTTKQTKTAQKLVEVEAPRRRKKKKQPKRSRFHQLVRQFFIAEEDDTSEADEGPYELDDGYWLSPENLEGGEVDKVGPSEHFIGEKSTDTPESTGAWGLSDKVWCQPSLV